jgi:nucleotide-binding universal stress UspA family protein
MKSRSVYKNILIPTDGSDLAAKAVQHGVALAKAVSSKVTALAVAMSFGVITLAMGVVVDTPAEYKKRV